MLQSKDLFLLKLVVDMKANCNYFDPAQTDNSEYKSHTKLVVAKPRDYAKVTRFLQHLFAWLFQDNELQVHQRRDRQGNTWWRAFDPNTRESVSFGSEAEMRSWIEQRYYR